MSAEHDVTAILRIKADASQAVREAGKLDASFFKVGKRIEAIADGFAKFNLALGGVEKAIGLVKSSLDFVRDVEGFHKLERAVPVKAFQALDKATGELWKKTDLLAVASRALNSDYKFTARQMADVANAARNLADKGIGTLEQNSEKLTKAVEKGGEGLDDFGIVIEKTGNKVKDTALVLEKLHGIAEGGAITEEAKAVAEMDRSFEQLALTLKETVVPVIVGLVHLMYETFAGWDDMLGGIDRRIAQRRQRDAENYLELQQQGAAFNADIQAAHDIDVRETYAGLNPNTMVGELGYMSALTAGMGAPSTKQNPRVYGKDIEVPVDYSRYGEEHAYEVNPFSTTGEGDFGGAAWDSSALDALEEVQNRLGGPDDYLSSNVSGGPFEKFKKDIGDTNTIAGQAYTTLASGITAAVDAAITGSDSIGKAAAKASAGVLKSLAMESTGRAIYEGALAIGSLAVGDAKGAALHGIAAGKFALAAAVTGGLAAGLGQIAGGGGGGGAAGAAGGSAGPAGGGYTPGRGNDGDRGGGGETYIFQFGDGFYGDANGIANAVAGAMRDHQRKGGRGNFNASFKG